MNLNEYIQWLRNTYKDTQISFTGLPEPYYGDPCGNPNKSSDRLNDLDQLGLLFGKELGKLKGEIRLCQQAILELNEEINAQKGKKQIKVKSKNRK